MAVCTLCSDLQFKSARQFRIYFDCTFEQLSKSASTCRTCRFIHQGISSIEWHLPSETIQRIEILGRTVSDDTGPSGLFADIYRPHEGSKLRLEYFKDPGTINALWNG